VECWGRTIPEDVLSRVLYATQFTRQIDRHGYVRFKHWKFFGENGLPAGEEASVWVYENTLKVEHQATTLSLYAVRLSSDQREITEVKNARRLETHFRSPRLDLWRLSDTEWLLALRRPAPVARKKLARWSSRPSNSFYQSLARRGRTASGRLTQVVNAPKPPQFLP
jgi:hypothetical protein